MGQSFISCDRGQTFLLPPSLTDWLAEDHLVWTVLGAVEQMDRRRNSAIADVECGIAVAESSSRRVDVLGRAVERLDQRFHLVGGRAPSSA